MNSRKPINDPFNPDEMICGRTYDQTEPNIPGNFTVNVWIIGKNEKTRTKTLNYYISSSGEYFYDFQYLKALSGFSSLKLQYLLDKEEISRVNYKNSYVYKLDDLYKSEIFKDLIQPTIVDMDDDTSLS